MEFDKRLKEHFIDSTSGLVASTPIFATFETVVAGLSDEVSLNARLLAVGLTYLGMGSVFAKGRDLYQ